MSTLKQRFAKLAELHPAITQADLARATGAKPPSVNAWFSGETKSMKAQTAAKAAMLYGCSPHWLATGEGEMLPAGGSVGAVTVNDSSLPDGAVHVPVLANAASMGGGADLMQEDSICGELTLTPQFVAEQLRPVRPAALRFIHGYGDSMAPTFNSGDVLLVDTDMREVRIDGIYVLEAHGRLFIKRVRQRMDGSFEISSDNPTHKTVDTLNGDHQVEVKGRVIWCWNGRRI